MDHSAFLSQPSRRQFLQAAALASGAVLFPNPGFGQSKDSYGGFRMGLQSYSLREFDTKTALEHTKTHGLKYWEAYPKHVPMSSVPKTVEESKKILAGAGVSLIAFGVLGFDKNETKAREAFDFAKAMGIRSLSADPAKDKETFDLLDKLVAEYDIAIAIHNHGPGHRYDKVKDVLGVVKDRHPKIGACVDTGHYLRSDENPVDVVKALGKRVFGVHVKDVKTTEVDGKKKKQFRILGEGDLDTLGLLKALKEINYDYSLSLEYEENPKNPLSDIEVSLKAVRDAVAKM